MGIIIALRCKANSIALFLHLPGESLYRTTHLFEGQIPCSINRDRLPFAVRIDRLGRDVMIRHCKGNIGLIPSVRTAIDRNNIAILELIGIQRREGIAHDRLGTAVNCTALNLTAVLTGTGFRDIPRGGYCVGGCNSPFRPVVLRRNRQDQGTHALGLIDGVGILQIILWRCAYAGAFVGILDGCGTRHLVGHHAVERPQTGFVVFYIHPAFPVCLDHGVGHHGRYGGFQLVAVVVGGQAAVLVDHVVPHAGFVILPSQHAVKQLGQIGLQLRTVAGRHHVNDIRQRHCVPADSTAPEPAIALAAVPAMMIQTSGLIVHVGGNPVKPAVNRVVNTGRCDRIVGQQAFIQCVGVLHQERKRHVDAVQTEFPGFPGIVIHLMMVVAAVFFTQRLLFIPQLVEDILNSGHILRIEDCIIASQQVKQRQSHGHGVNFTGTILTCEHV